MNFTQIMQKRGYKPLTNETNLTATVDDFDPLDPLDKKEPIGLKMDDCRKMLDALDPDCGYEIWRNLGMALHHEFQGSSEALALWDSWSSSGSKYRQKGPTPEDHWESFGKNKGRSITAAYLLKLTKKEKQPQKEISSEREKLDEAGFYYEKFKKEYLIKNPRGWLSLTESQFKQELARRGVSNKKRGEDLSPAEIKLMEIREHFDVDYVGRLAGYESGLYDMNGNRVLVTESPCIPEPAPGHCNTLRSVFENMLDKGSIKQTPFLYGWLKIGYESLRARVIRPGQMLVIAGPRDCGKSLTQKIFTEIFGGRVASPYAWMMGEQFNGQLFEAEHLAIEDSPSSTDIRARREFGSKIKQITATDAQPCHAKYKQTITLKPYWRVTLTVNDEPENLMILPPIDDSVEDKIIMILAKRSPMPMRTDSIDERMAFWETLKKEIPAFLQYLTEMKIPETLKSQRYGITHFHHPEILDELDGLAPETRLLSMIDQHLFDSDFEKQWTGTAEAMERVLDSSLAAHEAHRLFTWGNASGTYLGRLAKKYPKRFERSRKHGESAVWTIYRKGHED